MKSFVRFFVTLLLLFTFLSNTHPCGPGYVTPLFDTNAAPESPYKDYAAGQLGIVKPTFRRSVLFAAYKYITGGGLNAAEQQGLIDVWKAELDNKDFHDDSIDVAVKGWLAKRKEIVGKEEHPPEIYAERSYGGYDFFPNCTKNAFETAAETLSDRSTAHGPSDASVINWVKAQDQVFENCASSKQTPDDAAPGSPDWLQKDRAYQKAAAEFYSLDYDSAKKHFAEIAGDSESPWQETADYLVARTLIRQASLSKSKEKTNGYYEEAEAHLQHFVSKSGKFAASAERLMGLIRYRNHPKERVSELAKQLAFYGGNENFRQDVIDYNWLLDKFESEVLTAEQARKEAEKPKDANTAANSENEVPTSTSNTNSPLGQPEGKQHDDDLTLYLYTDEKSFTIYLKPDATDEDALAEAEKVVGHPLTADQKTQVKAIRQESYMNRFATGRQSTYEGGYWGEEKLTPSLMPEFLRQDDLTDWLYTYQMPGNEAYLYSLNKFKTAGSDLWLMTALSKAEKSSTGLTRLLEAAYTAARTSPAYTTIAYHRARILLLQGKSVEAKKLIDEMLAEGDRLPLSALNSFRALRVTIAETLEDYLNYSLKKPYGFNFDGEEGNINDFIAEQKAQYNPEYNTDGQAAYEAEIEANFKEYKEWQSRTMFDSGAIESFNQLFPTASLIEVSKSPALPDYLRERFVMAIWTRAYLVDDNAMLLKMTPELAKWRPEFAADLAKITAAKTPAAYNYAVLYFILKNPLVSPYIQDGTGKTSNEQDQFSDENWWCAPYDTEYDEATSTEVPKPLPPRPAFLTAAQVASAQLQRKKLKEIGDAPKYLAEKVMAWAKLSPADRRVPEALYIVIQANGWTKYGCGNDEELRDAYAKYLKAHYPASPWTTKLLEDEKGNQ